MPEPSSLGLMDVDESSFTQQVQRAMSEEPLNMDTAPPATTSTSPTADTGTDVFSFGRHFREISESEHVPLLLTCALYLLLVKLKEVSAGSSAADPATIVEGNLILFALILSYFLHTH